VIHVGDIKEGNSLCNDEVYSKNVEYFNSFDVAAVFVPGDNEWTDCHRVTSGRFDPLESLSLIRRSFYPGNKTLGKKAMTVVRQQQRFAEREFCDRRSKSVPNGNGRGISRPQWREHRVVERCFR
jgi:hypothetical protein